MLKRLACLATFALTGPATPSGIAAPASPFEIPIKDIKGRDTTLATYRGKVILAVNVASRCGLTKQYAALEALYRKYQDRGFIVLGFPCNQFMGQEPGSEAEIAEFCSAKYDVTFPLFSKLDVKGPGQHPLYAYLSGPASPFPGDVAWNFGKFLIGPDGAILARFEPRTAPDDPSVIAAIENALTKVSP